MGTPPFPERVFHNQYDCPKVSDGEASLAVASEGGISRVGLGKGNAPNQANPGKYHGMMEVMGDDDKTVTALVVKRAA